MNDWSGWVPPECFLNPAPLLGRWSIGGGWLGVAGGGAVVGIGGGRLLWPGFVRTDPGPRK